MNDRELLELAAKAAGIDWIKNCVWIENGFYSPLAKHERIAWNPLTDDGDAFRLAVKLELSILLRPYRVEVISWPQTTDVLGFGIPPTPRVIEIEPYGDDPQVATRRAIVRAAAEIGRNMP